jgi:hypothetical protein
MRRALLNLKHVQTVEGDRLRETGQLYQHTVRLREPGESHHGMVERICRRIWSSPNQNAGFAIRPIGLVAGAQRAVHGSAGADLRPCLPL